LVKAGQPWDEHTRRIRWDITGDRIPVIENRLRVQGTVTADAKKSPKTINVEAKGKGGISFVLVGIYALEGDVLKVRYVAKKGPVGLRAQGPSPCVSVRPGLSAGRSRSES
jgi:uncharacterized protein (TIGR03067 family)